MSNSPLLIDNIAFANRNERLSGNLTMADCPRLAELIASQTSEITTNGCATNHDDVIHFVLNGETDALGRYFLHLTVNAALSTNCQRCLDLMTLDFNLHFDYMISEADLNDAAAEEVEDVDEYDLQEASQAMDLRMLIEDEIIMALPIAPMHVHDCGRSSMQSGEKPNPFAVLKGLIKS